MWISELCGEKTGRKKKEFWLNGPALFPKVADRVLSVSHQALVYL